MISLAFPIYKSLVFGVCISAIFYSCLIAIRHAKAISLLVESSFSGTPYAKGSKDCIAAILSCKNDSSSDGVLFTKKDWCS
jgi:hypothetical protein